MDSVQNFKIWSFSYFILLSHNLLTENKQNKNKNENPPAIGFQPFKYLCLPIGHQSLQDFPLQTHVHFFEKIKFA